jgi:RTX calcium-binding nonapeptide repeat (4 copies)
MDMRRRGLELVSELLGVFKLALDQAARPAVVELAGSEGRDAPVTGSISPRAEGGAAPAMLASQNPEPVQLAALPPDLASPEAEGRAPPEAEQFAGPARSRAVQAEAPALVYQALGSGAASDALTVLQIDDVARIDVAMPLGEVPLAPQVLQGRDEDAPVFGALPAARLARPASNAVVEVHSVAPESPAAAETAQPAPVAEERLPWPEPVLPPPARVASQPAPEPVTEPEPVPQPVAEPEPEPELPRVLVVNGNEYYGTALADHIIGTAANDHFEGYAGDDSFDGAGGRNTVSYWSHGGESGVQIDLEAGTATDTYGDHDSLISIQNIRGSERHDAILGDMVGNFLRGDDGDDLIDGRSGDDALFGNAGADTLMGGAGRETLAGGQGADLIDGGEGHDLLDYSLDGGALGISVDLKTGFIIDSWGDLDMASNVEELRGTDQDDFIRLSDNGVRVELGRGDDWLFAGAGKDIIVLGREDGIFGVETGRDWINDFDIQLDVLDLSAAGYESLDDVLANAVGIDLGVALDDGHGNVITLVDVHISQLDQINYLFG